MNGELKKWQLIDRNENDGGQIRQFYAGKKVLLTGCTGFFGTGIIEKLLRTCSEIDKIYVIVRPKKNMTIEERMTEYFQGTVFDVLHKKDPNFTRKVVAMQGDLQKVDLGLSPEDRQHLKENVDIIIHNAAQVNFTAKVSSVLRINVLGTKYMLELAAECSRLKVFVYVSTGYSHSYNQEIEEKFYPPPGDLKMVEDMIRADEESSHGINGAVLREMVGKCVNVYTFSKCIAESLVEDFSRTTSVLCAVFRPTIIISSYKEPFPGWFVNGNGTAVVLIAIGLGLIHIVPLSEFSVVDFIPVDMTVNSLLAAIWDLSVHKKSKEAQVYNYGSSNWNPIILKSHAGMFFKITKEYPLDKMVWYPFVIFVGNFYFFLLLHLLIHGIPAALNDLVSMAFGKKMRALQIYIKFTKFSSLLHYFLNNNWIVNVRNVQNILIHMNIADYEEFNFDIGRVSANTFVHRHVLAVKVNLLKESLDTLPVTKKKYRRLMIAHYILCSLLMLSIMFFFYRMICYVCCY